MRVTFVGTGDAFGSGGRAHTCLRLDNAGRTLMIDFGAASIVGWRRLGFSFNDIDGLLITHLHGDHFGGLPFLLLEAQFVDPRDKPLTIYGPPGLRSRLSMAMEAFFPGTTGIKWRFPWEIHEIAPPSRVEIAGFAVRTMEVVHASGAPATAVRIEAGGKSFAFSGDTAWTDALLDISADAEERAIYVLDGSVVISGDRFPSDRLLVFRPGDDIVVSSENGAHFMLFGGASLGSKRYIWWNFVSSSKERIEQAKQEWKTGRFDIVPGDEEEFIPLPEG